MMSAPEFSYKGAVGVTAALAIVVPASLLIRNSIPKHPSKSIGEQLGDSLHDKGYDPTEDIKVTETSGRFSFKSKDSDGQPQECKSDYNKTDKQLTIGKIACTSIRSNP